MRVLLHLLVEECDIPGERVKTGQNYFIVLFDRCLYACFASFACGRMRYSWRKSKNGSELFYRVI